MISTIRQVLEVLGGSAPIPLGWRDRTSVALARGLWWLVLFAVFFAFAGRTVKFVYVDF